MVSTWWGRVCVMSLLTMIIGNRAIGVGVYKIETS